jgi:hypothetical protein
MISPLGHADDCLSSRTFFDATQPAPTQHIFRDQQAIEAVKAAIENPKTPTLPLIECEFPPLEALNKMGDGSLRSANLVDDVSEPTAYLLHSWWWCLEASGET